MPWAFPCGCARAMVSALYLTLQANSPSVWSGMLFASCPEVAHGLTVPRPPGNPRRCWVPGSRTWVCSGPRLPHLNLASFTFSSKTPLLAIGALWLRSLEGFCRSFAVGSWRWLSAWTASPGLGGKAVTEGLQPLLLLKDN